MSNIDYKKCNTTEVIKQAQNGDLKATEELIRRIQKNVFTMFSYLTDKRQDIADLTQDALLKIAKNIHTLQDINHFKPWINHIVTNTYYDYARKHTADNQIDYDEGKLLELKDKTGCEPGEKCLFSEMDKIIKIAVLGLPEHLRIAIVLREYEGLSYYDISKLTNTTIGTVKSRISRARGKLQEQLKEFI